MKLRFFPYELKLRHVFTVAAYSRTTTPDVQVKIEYDGIIGYGRNLHAAYLQHNWARWTAYGFLGESAGCYRTVLRSLSGWKIS